MRSYHPGQMGRAASRGDNHLEAPRFRGTGEFRSEPWRAMRGHDVTFVGDAKAFKSLGRRAHRFPVGLTAHDDADEEFRISDFGFRIFRLTLLNHLSCLGSAVW